MLFHRKRFEIVFPALVAVACLASASRVNAQISPDGTLPTLVNRPNSLDFAIESGTRSGSNLFHSFSQFSVPTGSAAVFNNPVDIQNIFSRVTGGTSSNIDGLIHANGNANLFLLNPSGIVFGPNARLDIGGSFLGTTASHIQFADGIEFSAINPTALLTMSVPIGLQMGQTSANIEVQNLGHTQIYDRATLLPFDRSSYSGGLAVTGSKTLTLLGGNILLNSGLLIAEDGQVNLGAVGVNNFVGLASVPLGWQLGYDGITQFGAIQLNERSLIDASGSRGGSIQLQGQQVDILNASMLLLQNSGSLPAGKIEVNAGILRIEGNSIAGRAVGGIITETLGNGRSGDIVIDAVQVQMRDGAQLGTTTFGPATGGSVQVRAIDRIELSGAALDNPSLLTGLGTVTLGDSGSAGDVSISTKQLAIQEGGAITTFSAAVGNGGKLTINASEFVKLSGISSFFRVPAGLLSQGFGQGAAGSVVINTPQLSLTNGAQISSSTFGSGAAGNITINAIKSVVIEGGSTIDTLFIPSRITSASELATPEVQQIFELQPFPTGSSGNVEINTPALNILDRAFISVANNSANGNGGSLKIRAGDVILKGDATLSASTRSGEGGNILINANLLSLRTASHITTTASGAGDGGDLVIVSPIVIGLENSDLIATAQQGRGGNIKITTQGILGLKYRDRLTSESDITASSEFGVNGTVQVNTIGIAPNSGLTVLPIDLIDASQQIATDCTSNQSGSFVVTGRGGVPHNPIQAVHSERPWQDIRHLSTLKPVNRKKHTAAIASPQIIEATTWQLTPQGQPQLIAGRPISPPQGTTCVR
jgi:filamentous hemagglutinin family protein